jgi:hypothetical protein
LMVPHGNGKCFGNVAAATLSHNEQTILPAPYARRPRRNSGLPGAQTWRPVGRNSIAGQETGA